MTFEFLLNFSKKEVAIINSRSAVVISCWFAVALISSVYIWVALGGGFLGDIMFGLFVPVGLLVMVALVVTFGLPASETSSETETKLETTFSSGLREINSKIDSLIKEVEAIKKTLEE